MRYKCRSCGEVFDEEEAGKVRESRGEFWGEPCYETMLCCPTCGCMSLDEREWWQDEEEEEEEDEAD